MSQLLTETGVHLRVWLPFRGTTPTSTYVDRDVRFDRLALVFHLDPRYSPPPSPVAKWSSDHSSRQGIDMRPSSKPIGSQR